MSYEPEKAVKEASFNAAWQGWVDACPARNTSLAEGLFKVGFDRGWDHKEEEANTDRLRAYNLIKAKDITVETLYQELVEADKSSQAKDTEIAQLKRDVTHWQSNHANEVKRSRILKERPDMPITRVHAYQAWGEDLKDLEKLRKNQARMETLERRETLIRDLLCQWKTGAIGAAGVVQALFETVGSAPASTPKYHDTTPHLHVGDSAFESWYANYNPATLNRKQLARDAYAAGMGDPLVEAKDPAEVPLHIIRQWPAGFQERFFAVWADVAGMIPNVRLYDLQRVLAEFGFTLRVYEDLAHPTHRCGGLGCDGTCCQPVSIPSFGPHPNGNTCEAYTEVDPAFAAATYQHDLITRNESTK